MPSSAAARHAASPVGRCDPELERVRCLLAALRPDCADPLSPPVAEAQAAQMMRVRDPMATWGGTPRGLGAQLDNAALFAATPVADIYEAIDALPAPAPAVLRWLRHHGVLDAAASDGGLRGLYVDVARAFVGDVWRDLAAQREGAHSTGRLLVLRSAGAWGR